MEINAWSGVAVLGLTLALIAGRRWGRYSVGAGVAALLVGLALAGGGVALGIDRVPNGSMTPQFHETLVTLERLVAETDAWVAEHGRVPTGDEWAAMHDAPPVDGWGRPFEYMPMESGDHYGRRYQIISPARNRGKSSAIVWDIPSYWLGEDGRFGTDDDWRTLEYGLEGVAVERYAHHEGR